MQGDVEQGDFEQNLVQQSNELIVQEQIMEGEVGQDPVQSQNMLDVEQNPFQSQDNALRQNSVQSQKMQCNICWQPFTFTRRAPITLRCGHTHCARCVEVLQRGDPDNLIRCPSCRGEQTEEAVVSYSLRDYLSANNALAEEIEDDNDEFISTSSIQSPIQLRWDLDEEEDDYDWALPNDTPIDQQLMRNYHITDMGNFYSCEICLCDISKRSRGPTPAHNIQPQLIVHINGGQHTRLTRLRREVNWVRLRDSRARRNARQNSNQSNQASGISTSADRTSNTSTNQRSQQDIVAEYREREDVQNSGQVFSSHPNQSSIQSNQAAPTRGLNGFETSTHSNQISDTQLNQNPNQNDHGTESNQQVDQQNPNMFGNRIRYSLGQVQHEDGFANEGFRPNANDFGDEVRSTRGRSCNVSMRGRGAHQFQCVWNARTERYVMHTPEVCATICANSTAPTGQSENNAVMDNETDAVANQHMDDFNNGGFGDLDTFSNGGFRNFNNRNNDRWPNRGRTGQRSRGRSAYGTHSGFTQSGRSERARNENQQFGNGQQQELSDFGDDVNSTRVVYKAKAKELDPDYRKWLLPNPLFKTRKDSQQVLCFYTKKYYFSNHYGIRQQVDGTFYCCNEQFYMYRKATLFGFTEAAKEIMSTYDTKTIKNLGNADTLRDRKAKGLEPNARRFDHDEWKKVKEEIMLCGLRAKFSQNCYFSKMLIATKDVLLAEANPYDIYWGTGCTIAQIEDQNLWRGQNRMGILLMKLREELQRDRKTNLEAQYDPFSSSSQFSNEVLNSRTQFNQQNGMENWHYWQHSNEEDGGSQSIPKADPNVSDHQEVNAQSASCSTSSCSQHPKGENGGSVEQLEAEVKELEEYINNMRHLLDDVPKRFN